MTYAEMTAKIELLNHYDAMITSLKEQADEIRNSLKSEMVAQNVDTMVVGEYIIRYTDVLSNRFDSTAFKKVMPEVYKSFVKQVASRRFTISV